MTFLEILIGKTFLTVNGIKINEIQVKIKDCDPTYQGIAP